MAEKKKHILITGAASGLGRAITEYLVDKGNYVIAADILAEHLQDYNSESVMPVQMDVTDPESISKAAADIAGHMDGLDGLVNCAGMFTGGSLVEIPDEDVERIIDVNVVGMYRVTKLFFPLLFKRRGRIVNISSEAGCLSGPFNGPYSMSKYAVEAYSDALRRELMFLDMDVAIIQAGAIRTSLLNNTSSVYERYFGSPHFDRQLRRIGELAAKEQEKAVDAKEVAIIVYDALHSANPKIRYRINCDKGRTVLTFLPAAWTDWLIKKML